MTKHSAARLFIVATFLLCITSAHAENTHKSPNTEQTASCWPENFNGFFAVDKKIQCLVANTQNPFSISPHKANYIIPASYYSNPVLESLDKVELKFQMSIMSVLKRNIFNTPIHALFAYTNQSYWQAFNADLSSPFRETNHEPEFMLALPVDWGALGIRHRLLTLGLSHQSNGETVPQSRSWNRLYLDALFEHGNLYSSLKTWYRFPEEEKDNVMDALGDDNPDILDYMGYFEWRTMYKTDTHSLTVMLRNNLDTEKNRGALQIDYTYPINGKIQGYAQIFTGYGESLIDYDRRVHRIGLGIMMANWL